MKLHPLGKLRLFQTDGPQQNVDPFVSAKLLTTLAICAEVETTELDRAQVFHVESVIVGVDVVVGDRSLGPDATLKQALIIPVKSLADGNALGREVLQRGPVTLFLFDVADMD